MIIVILTPIAYPINQAYEISQLKFDLQTKLVDDAIMMLCVGSI